MALRACAGCGVRGEPTKIATRLNLPGINAKQNLRNGGPVRAGARDKLAGTKTALVGLEINNLQVLFTDAYPVTLVGLLGITFRQLSPDYGTIRHSNADTLDKVDAATLAYDAELVAVSSFWIPSPATGAPLASSLDGRSTS
jgi:hypothetical protein